MNMLNWIISVLIALVITWVVLCFIYGLECCENDIFDAPRPVLWTLLIVLTMFAAGVVVGGVFVVHEAIECMMGLV